ncbi:DUF899 domain-containing protein [Pararhizobium mangrovi]|uniref:DUF899 domain-containing protein n=1 Tax=Pararhizobium mangrovi TaxID=2590452 RepID=A0A506U593_9HYPH|nr:DUF899 domain-containing protein [Pararhizobium mangrovi]TPW27719.1 DUF899 domain-containing protein [Pararhizobium mangrovi]
MIADIPNFADHKVVSQEEELKARMKHLRDEVALTHALDRLRAERRALPWVRVEKQYVFDAPTGKVELLDLFEGRSQLVVHHFMLTPGSDHVCPGCSFIADHTETARQHFEQADLSFAAISRAPVPQIERVKKRMGWTFAWVSSGDSDFNYDFTVAFTPEAKGDGGAPYNFGKERITKADDMFGISMFAMRDGAVYHTYSTYRRGAELLMGALNWLDLAPKGRNEEGAAHSWLRLHDAY